MVERNATISLISAGPAVSGNDHQPGRRPGHPPTPGTVAVCRLMPAHQHSQPAPHPGKRVGTAADELPEQERVPAWRGLRRAVKGSVTCPGSLIACVPVLMRLGCAVVPVVTTEGVHPVQLTIDSTEPLESVLAVLGSVYQVQLASAPRSDAPTASAPAPTAKTTKGTRAPGRTTTSSTGATGGSRRGRSNSAAAVDSSAVRAWAREHDVAVSVRGRIPASLLSAYRDAHA